MNTQVLCSHPSIILNPNLAEFLCMYHTYFIFGHEHYYPFSFRGLHDDGFKKEFYGYKDYVTHENLDQCYVCDTSTGATYPIYLEVPCGRCDVCRRRKVNAFVNRCRLESNLYDSRPWFFTLTYDNDNKPSDGVSVRDVQLFLKRFRINLERYGYRERIRYVACGEYGKNTHRPHYHLIIWNLHPTIYTDYKELVAIADQSWNKGFIQSRIIDPSNDKSFYYTSKYLLKDCKVPHGCNDTFLVYSRGHGSIGSAMIDQLAGKLRKSLNVSFQYFDKWRQKSVVLPMSSYIINRVFPSLCRSITSSVRTAVRQFDYLYSEFIEREPTLSWLFEDTHEKLHLFQNSIYFGSHGVREHPICPLSDAQVYSNLREYQRVIERAANKAETYDKAKELDRLRGVFLGRFAFPQRTIDIAALEYRCRRNRLRSHATEVL